MPHDVSYLEATAAERCHGAVREVYSPVVVWLVPAWQLAADRVE